VEPPAGAFAAAGAGLSDPESEHAASTPRLKASRNRRDRIEVEDGFMGDFSLIYF
jgi:hypothetical protein